MKNIEREELRKLQDKVIEHLIKIGYLKTDKLGIYDNNMRVITLADLEKYLYPQYKIDFQNFLLEE